MIGARASGWRVRRTHAGRTGRRWIVLAALVALVAVAGGCGARRGPVLERLVQRDSRVPVVLIPGITGSELVDAGTGKVLWGRGHNLLAPRDGGYSMALPPDGMPRTGGPEIVPGGPVLDLRLFGILRTEIYGPLWRTLERNGYVAGDLAAPSPDATLFAFTYDWRRGNRDTAASLADALERLRVARGEPTLRVDVIGHSNAARLMRWYLRYGGGSIEEAESGRARPPSDVRVRRLILVGADHAGSIDVLRRLDRGRRYVPGIGRKILPETMLTYESLVESLPTYGDHLFFDRNGDPVDADLLEVDDWKRFGWSVFAPETRARVARRSSARVPADERVWTRYLEQALGRLRRSRALLARDPEDPLDTRFYVIRNLRERTGHRALLERDSHGTWRTRFEQDDEIRRDPYLDALATTAGDGYAPIESQQGLSAAERAALAHPPADVGAGHRQLIRHPATLRLVLEYLAEP